MDQLHFFCHDEPVLDHLLNLGHDGHDTFLRIHHVDYHRQVQRKPEHVDRPELFLLILRFIMMLTKTFFKKCAIQHKIERQY